MDVLAAEASEAAAAMMAMTTSSPVAMQSMASQSGFAVPAHSAHQALPAAGVQAAQGPAPTWQHEQQHQQQQQQQQQQANLYFASQKERIQLFAMREAQQIHDDRISLGWTESAAQADAARVFAEKVALGMAQLNYYLSSQAASMLPFQSLVQQPPPSLPQGWPAVAPAAIPLASFVPSAFPFADLTQSIPLRAAAAPPLVHPPVPPVAAPVAAPVQPLAQKRLSNEDAARIGLLCQLMADKANEPLPPGDKDDNEGNGVDDEESAVDDEDFQWRKQLVGKEIDIEYEGEWYGATVTRVRKDVFTLEYVDDDSIEVVRLFKDFTACDPQGETTFKWRMRLRKKRQIAAAPRSPRIPAVAPPNQTKLTEQEIMRQRRAEQRNVLKAKRLEEIAMQEALEAEMERKALEARVKRASGEPGALASENAHSMKPKPSGSADASKRSRTGSSSGAKHDASGESPGASTSGDDHNNSKMPPRPPAMRLDEDQDQGHSSSYSGRDRFGSSDEAREEGESLASGSTKRQRELPAVLRWSSRKAAPIERFEAGPSKKQPRGKQSLSPSLSSSSAASKSGKPGAPGRQNHASKSPLAKGAAAASAASKSSSKTLSSSPSAASPREGSFSPRKSSRALGFLKPGTYGFSPPKADKAVGWRVRVWWTDDNSFYAGHLVRYRSSTGKHRLEYDDGVVEWISVDSEQMEWFVPADLVLASVSIDPAKLPVPV